MGGAPYKSAKEGGGCSFKCFRIQPPMWCLKRLDALQAYNWTSNNIQRSNQSQSLWSWCNIVCSTCHILRPSMQSYVPCNNLWWSITWSLLHSAWGCAFQTTWLCSEMLTPGWAINWVNFDPIPKVGGGDSFARLQCPHFAVYTSMHARCHHQFVNKPLLT